jgi:hypothetical protein
MADRSRQNWVAEPVPPPWRDHAFPIVVTVTIAMALALWIFLGEPLRQQLCARLFGVEFCSFTPLHELSKRHPSENE